MIPKCKYRKLYMCPSTNLLVLGNIRQNYMYNGVVFHAGTSITRKVGQAMSPFFCTSFTECPLYGTPLFQAMEGFEYNHTFVEKLELMLNIYGHRLEKSKTVDRIKSSLILSLLVLLFFMPFFGLLCLRYYIDAPQTVKHMPIIRYIINKIFFILHVIFIDIGIPFMLYYFNKG